MTKINGTEQLEVSNSLGYARLSGALVNAACDYFFQRRGMARSEQGRFGFLPLQPKSSYDRKPGARVVRVKLADLSRAKKHEGCTTQKSGALNAGRIIPAVKGNTVRAVRPTLCKVSPIPQPATCKPHLDEVLPQLRIPEAALLPLRRLLAPRHHLPRHRRPGRISRSLDHPMNGANWDERDARLWSEATSPRSVAGDFSGGKS